MVPGSCRGEVRVEIVVVNPRTGARSETIVARADTGGTVAVIVPISPSKPSPLKKA